MDGSGLHRRIAAGRLRSWSWAHRRGLTTGLAIALLVPASTAFAVSEDIGGAIQGVDSEPLDTAASDAGAASGVYGDLAFVDDDLKRIAEDLGIGEASWYGSRFAGRPTASGEPFDPQELTAAHRSLPFGSRVLVTSARTGKAVVVRINDRGPYHGDRVIDLSEAAATLIGIKHRGSGQVELALLPG